MNTRDSTTPNRENLVDGNLQTQWISINWKEAEASINRLQVRIAKATKERKWNLVKRLQYLLTHSFYAKALAGTNRHPKQGKENHRRRWRTLANTSSQDEGKSLSYR